MNIKSLFTGLRSFFILWSSQTVSELGTAMTNFALIVWVYSQQGTASSVTLLSICSFLPTILFRFIAGTIADCWNKKRVMLITDLAAACGTAAVFALYAFSALQIWHLYIINVLLSFMNAFQNPASYVAVSMLVPKEQYARVGGLQAFSGSAVSILAPALGSLLMAFGGMEVVLTVDLASFAVAFFTLLFFVRIPDAERQAEESKTSFWESCLAGIRYLRVHTPLLHIILFFTIINFLAKMGGDGMMSPFVLGRTGNDQKALGMVETATALGILAGSLLMMLAKPAQKKAKVIFVCCAFTFSGNVIQSLTHTLPAWCIAAFASYASAAVLNANLTAVMRAHVPIEMQGRVFSAKDTIQNCTIPLGLLLGGVLADYVFEPFMSGHSAVQAVLAVFFGSGGGTGIALMFFGVGILGVSISLSRLRKPIYDVFDKDMDDESKDSAAPV